jgi:organic radical activating enzyme
MIPQNIKDIMQKSFLNNQDTLNNKNEFNNQNTCSYYDLCKKPYCYRQKEKVLAYVNETCFYNCPYCTRFIKFKSKLDIENLDDKFKYLSTFSNISFTGGEPTQLSKEEFEILIKYIYKYDIQKKSVILSANSSINLTTDLRLRFHHRLYNNTKILERKNTDHVIVAYPRDISKIYSFIFQNKKTRFTLYFDRMTTSWSKEEQKVLSETILLDNASIHLKYLILEYLKEDLNIHLNELKHIIMQRCCGRISTNLYVVD